VQASFGDQLAATPVHFFEQRFARIIDEAHTAQVNEKFPPWRGGVKCPPALLERDDPLPCQASFHTQDSLATLVFCGNSKHIPSSLALTKCKFAAKAKEDEYRVKSFTSIDL